MLGAVTESGVGGLAGLLAALLLATAAPLPAQEAPPPAVVALALDTSGSVPAETLARARALALEVLGSLPEGSQVAVFTFDDRSRLVQPRTADRGLVGAAVDGARSAGRFTALHDALYDASRYLTQTPPTRRAIVLLTDGRDENSALLLEDGLRLATDDGIPVFAVGIGRVEERELRRIAKLTGGDYVPLAQASGRAIAAAVSRLDARAAEPAPAGDAAAEPAATPAPSAAADARRPIGWLTLSVGLLLGVIAALATAVLRRQRHPTLRPIGSRVAAAPRRDTGGDVSPTVVLPHRAALRIVRGLGQGREIRLEAGDGLSIGRSRENQLILDDEAISALHCSVRLEDDGWVVRDLGSTNGTRVNERRVDRHRLRGGDLIQLGETSLQFVER